MYRARLIWNATCLSLMLAVVSPSTARGQAGTTPDLPDVANAAHHDTSQPLTNVPVNRNRPRTTLNKAVQTYSPTDLIGRHRPTAQREDPVRQVSGAPTGLAATPPGSSFEGLGDDDNASIAGVRLVPADTQGDVGPDHYIQMINVIFAVYAKDTGQIVGGPFPNNVIWDGFGGPCEANNDGDPIVLYDHIADRWVFTQFAISGGGWECIAVSATSDPLGAYHRYAFLVSPGRFSVNDYPKFGVWPDGYYMTANEFGGGRRSFQGAVAVAFEREAMLAGQPAQMVKFGPLACGSECFFAIQPSHLEGPPPPDGTPNTFIMAFDDETWGTGTKNDSYRLWDFAVDWGNPSNSAFTALTPVQTAEFDAELCNFSRNCIPQPSPGEGLDSLSQFTMYRAQFRDFVDYQTLVVNHTVDAGSNTAGIRWTELRNNGAGWSVYQTGTFAPSTAQHRWMGSAAMDAAGDIALGYSISGTSTYPSINYTTRTSGDALGTLPGGEATLVAGDAVQTASSNRWGDYSSMSVDPGDDCTFWYTQQYQRNDGDGSTSFDFKTRIGHFTLPTCSGFVPGGIQVTPAAATMAVGDSQALRAMGTSGSTLKELTWTATWQTSNPAVATVDARGVVTAVAAGTARISATAGGTTGYSDVTVTGDAVSPVLSSIAVTPPSASIDVGDTQQFIATGHYTSGPDQDLTGSVTWTSTDTGVATINGSGLATGVSDGATTITAAFDGITSNPGALLTVNAPVSPVLSSITITPSSASIDVGKTQQFTATGHYTSGPDQDLTGSVNWTSTNPGVATINGSGLATGVSNGGTTITATLGAITSNAGALTVNAPTGSAPLSITGINPASMTRGSTRTLTITGTGFEANMTLSFENGSGPAPVVNSVSFAGDQTQVTASVTAKSGGPSRASIWDVRLTRSDGTSAVLPNGLTIQP